MEQEHTHKKLGHTALHPRQPLKQKAFIQSQISLLLACSSPAKPDNQVVQFKRFQL